MEAFEIEVPTNLPNDDVIDINISDVMAAIETADPTYSTNTAPAGGGAESNMDQQEQMQHPDQQQQQQQQAANTARSMRRRAHVRIVEQPASKALRFRYECEGRSAGSIPGVNSTPENKTFPTIEIADYVGLAVVVVSCVTKDPPYRPHPHNLVGKEGCKKGVCTLQIKPDTMRAVFSNLGIQCVKKKDIESALRARDEIRVDPFKTGFSHRFQPASIDLNSVRLCFQVFLEDTQGRFTVPLVPVVSDPIYDKKAMSDLVICKLCKCSSTVAGGKEIILLCEKVTKEDIAVRFFEEKDGQVIWEAYGEFQHTDVHKQTAINFRTPKYRTLDIEQPVKAYIQLKRPSDGATSEPLQFDFLPLDSEPGYLKRKRQKFAGEASSHLFRFHAQEQKNHQDQHQPQDGHHHMGFLNLNQGTAIKAEPRDTSPLPYGLFPNSTTYRLPENSPSPQPLSPPAPLYNLSNTPSPYNMAAGGGNMMSPNAQQYGGGAAAAGSLSPNMTVDMNDGGQYHGQYQPQPGLNMTNYNQMPSQIQQQPQHQQQQPHQQQPHQQQQQQQHQQQQHHWNLPPATTTSTINNLLTTNSTLVASQPQWSIPSGIKQEQMHTVNSLSTNPFMMGASISQHQQPQHHQQNHPQQPHTHHQQTSNMNLNEAPNISSLLDMDSEQLIQFNSAELSGLSLS